MLQFDTCLGRLLKKRPVFGNFSTVVGSRGSALRDVTPPGNLRLLTSVGLSVNTPRPPRCLRPAGGIE